MIGLFVGPAVERIIRAVFDHGGFPRSLSSVAASRRRDANRFYKACTIVLPNQASYLNSRFLMDGHWLSVPIQRTVKRIADVFPVDSPAATNFTLGPQKTGEFHYGA
jgi:hypothetical protein